MEIKTITIEQFRQVKNNKGGHVKPSPERLILEAMEPNTAISLELETLACNRQKKSCSLAGITKALGARYSDRRWSMRHEVGTDIHYVACFAVSDNNTG